MSSHIFIGVSLLFCQIIFFFLSNQAIFMIPTNPPPTFRKPELWSDSFMDFVKQCLVKSPEQRATATQLLQVWLTLGCCLSLCSIHKLSIQDAVDPPTWRWWRAVRHIPCVLWDYECTCLEEHRKECWTGQSCKKIQDCVRSENGNWPLLSTCCVLDTLHVVPFNQHIHPVREKCYFTFIDEKTEIWRD